MKRDMEKETPETRNLSRREALGLIGATAAASLVGGVAEQPASAEQTGAPIQNTKSRIVQFAAKPEPVAIDIAKTAVIVVDMQNDLGVATFWQRASATSQTERGASGLGQHGRASTPRNALRGKRPAAATPPRPWVGSSASRNVPSCL